MNDAWNVSRLTEVRMIISHLKEELKTIDMRDDFRINDKDIYLELNSLLKKYRMERNYLEAEEDNE